MRILCGIIRSFLLLPFPLKVIVEFAFILILASAVWIFLRWIPVIVIKVLEVLNKLLTMANRQLLCVIFGKNKNVYDWDEKIGRLGQKIDYRLNIKSAWLKESNWRQILKSKKCIVILVTVYFLAILPYLPIKNVINEYYFEHISVVNKMFVRMEKWMEEKTEGYPPLINYTKPLKNTEDAINLEQPYIEFAEERILLQLNRDTSYANVRETPEMEGRKLCVVGRDDTMVYQSEYMYDNERYWLKVIVESQNSMEGWISSRVLETNIVNELNLQ